MAARALNLILGLWLFVSAFLFVRAPATFTNTWIVGLLVATMVAIAIKTPSARYLNTALSAWLLVSAFVLPHATAAERWHDAIVAVAIFALSLVPTTERTRLPRRVPA
jgi:hypothetical protein